MHSNNEKLRFRGWRNSKGGDLEPPRPWELYQEYFSWYKESDHVDPLCKNIVEVVCPKFRKLIEIKSVQCQINSNNGSTIKRDTR
jgi:hypothetical protein